jgi:hypothetical protein
MSGDVRNKFRPMREYSFSSTPIKGYALSNWKGNDCAFGDARTFEQLRRTTTAIHKKRRSSPHHQVQPAPEAAARLGDETAMP